MRWLDRAYLRFSPRLGCFERGFGDDTLLARPFDDTETRTEPTALHVRFSRARVHGALRILDGAIETPEEMLPIESRVARVRWLKPREGEPRAMAVAMAAWGDEGFAARQRLFADAVRAGISIMLLENPFYGERRRVGQRGARLSTVSDFLLMGRAAVRESHGLIAWARAQGIERVGVVGYSMGGQMAAISAALAPWPLHVVAIATAASPASVFLEGPLERDVAWSALGEGGRARLHKILTSISVLSMPPIRDRDHATLVGTRNDLIVPPRDVAAIARHWRVSPRWLEDGHVSAIALRSHAISQAVVDTFAR